MAYLGRGLDKISNIEVLDNITFDGSSSYSITKGSVAFTPNSAQSCLISIDGVVQATNFTVSSSTINFGVAVPSTSTCNFFLHYGTGVMTVPSDGSVTNAKISYPLAESGATVSTFNRTSSDGSILEVQRNGTTIGSIGVLNSDNPFFQGNATNHGGLQCGTNTILPVKSSVNSDNTIDLGQSDIRWKDIYLSGGAFIGGTGTANKLDDYEEGTWTPSVIYTGGQTATLSNANATYTKIGRIVNCNLYFDISNTNSGSGNVRISNLPFTVEDILTPTGLEASGSVGYWGGFSSSINFLSITADHSNILIPQCSTGNVTALSSLTASQLGTGEMRASITYITSQ